MNRFSEEMTSTKKYLIKALLLAEENLLLECGWKLIENQRELVLWKNPKDEEPDRWYTQENAINTLKQRLDY